MATLGFGTNVTSNVLYQQFPQITVQQYNSGSGLVVSTFNASEIDQLGGATKTLAPAGYVACAISRDMGEGPA